MLQFGYMTIFAIGLILFSAVLHATWNLLAKRVQGGAAFLWFYDVLALGIFAPFVLLFVLFFHMSFSVWTYLFILVSGLLELTYFLLLQRGYRVGDLSLVYPLARGTGPFLASTFAILVFKEKPTVLSLCGTACIVSGILLIAWSPRRLRDQRSRLAVLYGILTGCCIACYTLWDKEALSIGHIAPLVLYYGTICIQVPALTPYALHHWQEVGTHWRLHRLEGVSIAVLNAIAYILVLTALAFTPVSFIAPFREVSVLLGILLGTRVLAEKEAKRRLFAASILVVGIIALAL